MTKYEVIAEEWFSEDFSLDTVDAAVKTFNEWKRSLTTKDFRDRVWSAMTSSNMTNRWVDVRDELNSDVDSNSALIVSGIAVRAMLFN